MITAAQGVLNIERRIAASPETVFSYFVDPERYAQWQGVEAEIDPRPGGLFRVRMTGRSGAVVRGAFVEIDPPRRLVYTWGWEPLERVDDEIRAAVPEAMRNVLPEGMTEVPPGSSTVEIVLVPDGDSTILGIRHSGLPGDAAGRFHSMGWNMSLERLVIIAQGGDAGPSVFTEL